MSCLSSILRGATGGLRAADLFFLIWLSAAAVLHLHSVLHVKEQRSDAVGGEIDRLGKTLELNAICSFYWTFI